MKIDFVNPEALPKPSGFSHGVVASGGGRILFVGGQTAVNNQTTVYVCANHACHAPVSGLEKLRELLT